MPAGHVVSIEEMEGRHEMENKVTSTAGGKSANGILVPMSNANGADHMKGTGVPIKRRFSPNRLPSESIISTILLQ
jgi:hypothetical protein